MTVTSSCLVILWVVRDEREKTQGKREREREGRRKREEEGRGREGGKSPDQYSAMAEGDELLTPWPVMGGY